MDSQVLIEGQVSEGSILMLIVPLEDVDDG